MVQCVGKLTRALHLVKDLAEKCLNQGDDPGPGDLEALLDALEPLRTAVNQKLKAQKEQSASLENVNSQRARLVQAAKRFRVGNGSDQELSDASPFSATSNLAPERTMDDADHSNHSAQVDDERSNPTTPGFFREAFDSYLRPDSQASGTEPPPNEEEVSEPPMADYIDSQHSDIHLGYEPVASLSPTQCVIPNLSGSARSQRAYNDVSIASDLENFDTDMLKTAMRQAPVKISRQRYLRILQYVNSIGLPPVLPLVEGLIRPSQDSINEPEDKIVSNNLVKIHLYLTDLESQDHRLVAKHRYSKYRYYETYLLAVKSLQKEKLSSRRARKKIEAHKGTATYKQGYHERPSSAQHISGVHEAAQESSPAEKNWKASVIVKNRIVKKVATVSKRDEQRIGKDFNRYIKEGKVLKNILQGAVRADPGLFVLFPSREPHPPSLIIDQLNIDLEEIERKRLCKPLALEDIDDLKPVEARWFGKVLEARLASLGPLPEGVLSIPFKNATDYAHLQGFNFSGYDRCNATRSFEVHRMGGHMNM
ncbi:hypothetical protein PMIN03_010571 [Paraphaeosphaeria minitans]